jgi:antitoxin VapB
MALSIKSDRADQLARELALLTGESITDTVITSLERRLAEERRLRRRRSVDDLVERFRALPVLDARSADEIIGYDENGLPA